MTVEDVPGGVLPRWLAAGGGARLSNADST
jgi:hypothetical protein